MKMVLLAGAESMFRAVLQVIRRQKGGHVQLALPITNEDAGDGDDDNDAAEKAG
jgi:hypothetical protein